MTKRPPRPERPRLREVAAAAGVALSSASRALSNHPDVSPKMRDRVLAAAIELGYERNLLWDSLREGTTATVGVVLREVSSPLLAQMSLGAELALQQRGFSMLLSNSRGVPDLDVQHMRLLDQRRVDGLLVQPADITNQPTIETLARLRVPFVALDREIPAELPGGAVLIDHEGGMRKAVEYLSDLGHRSIGLVAPPSSSRTGSELISTLQRLGAERGLQVVIEEAPFDSDRVTETAAAVLGSDVAPTAMIAGSQHASPGVLLALRAAGLRVRDDVSVLVFDDDPMLPCFAPAITVVSKSPLRVGEIAANLLADMIHGASGEVLRTATELIIRDSCGAPTRVR